MINRRNKDFRSCRGSLLKVLLPALILVACTEQIDWELEYLEEEVLVVEGKLTSEPGPHRVTLSKPVYEMNAIPEPVSGARVDFFDGRSLYPLQEDPLQPGTYLTEPGFAGEPGNGYQLRIRQGGRRITAVSFMEPVTPFQFMRTVKVQEDPPLYRVYISDSGRPAIVRLILDWSHLPGYDTLPDHLNHAVIYHYTLNSIDVNEIFAPEQEQVLFPPGTVVYREKESVGPRYEEFLRGMLSETDWRGGIFDVLPGNARTNLDEGAIGYFTATEVIRDTLIVE